MGQLPQMIVDDIKSFIRKDAQKFRGDPRLRCHGRKFMCGFRNGSLELIVELAEQQAAHAWHEIVMRTTGPQYGSPRIYDASGADAYKYARNSWRPPTHYPSGVRGVYKVQDQSDGTLSFATVYKVGETDVGQSYWKLQIPAGTTM